MRVAVSKLCIRGYQLIGSDDLKLISGIKAGAAPDIILAVVAGIEAIARPHNEISAGIHSVLDSGRRFPGGLIMKCIETDTLMKAVLHPNIAAIGILVGITL